MAKVRDESLYGTGHEDGLSPLTPLDPSKTDSVDALVRAMSHTAFGGRRLGEAADTNLGGRPHHDADLSRRAGGRFVRDASRVGGLTGTEQGGHGERQESSGTRPRHARDELLREELDVFATHFRHRPRT